MYYVDDCFACIFMFVVNDDRVFMFIMFVIVNEYVYGWFCFF